MKKKDEINFTKNSTGESCTTENSIIDSCGTYYYRESKVSDTAAPHDTDELDDKAGDTHSII